MAIEFGCPGCQQTLRVPDTAAGKVAKCPSCSTAVTVPAENTAAETPAREEASSARDLSALTNPFAEANKPYASETIQPFQVGGVPLNPYASPGGYEPHWQPRFGEGKVGHQQITVTAILQSAVALWQEHLGLLIGMSALLWVIGGGFHFLSQQLLDSISLIGDGTVWVAALMFRLVFLIVMTFLRVGQVQMCLKMCRREPVEFTDLFQGRQFWPALLAVLLVAIPYEVLTTAVQMTFNVSGLSTYDAVVASAWLLGLVSLVFNLLFWPYFYLVIDEKASVLASFGMAYRVTEGNRATTFLTWICSLVIGVIGMLACCVGLVAAMPLIMLVQTVAYLMMSGQMPPEGYQRRLTSQGS